jgi:zinc protease
MPSAHRGSVALSLARLYETGTATALPEPQLLEMFITQRDESALEAILLRHGPMVLRVCERVLDDPHDIDDAFQATFLVLVKKAGSIRRRDVLGTWLYGVARRVAVRARVNSRRRQARERTGIEGIDVVQECTIRAEASELRCVLHDEIERLPRRYRAPVVLCDLEGQTHEQAATQLCCPVGTIKSRLSRGRERLGSRLARRGLSGAALGPALALASDFAPSVPPAFISQTMRAATELASRACSARVAALVEGVSRAMFFSKLTIAASAVLAAAVTITAARTFLGQATPSQVPAGPGARGDAPVHGKAPPQGAGPAGTSAAKRPPRAAEKPRRPPEPGTERYQLENGLTVILRPIRAATQAALVVSYSIGSHHDPEGLSGLAHTLEHVYVTAAGQDKGQTARDLSTTQFALAALTGRFKKEANGQTGDRYTIFSAVFAASDLDREVEDAAARMGALRVTAADLDRERPRLLQEVENMFGGFPALAAMNNARELVRPTPRGGRHGGPPEHLRKITAEQVQAHWNRYYKPGNAILALAGAIDPAAARRAIAAHFAKLPPGENAPAPAEAAQPKLGTAVELSVAARGKEAMPTACLAYPAPQPGSELYVPFLVLVSRLWALGPQLGGVGPTGSPVFFTPLDDGAVVAVSTPAKPGENAAKAFARIEAYVADAIEKKLLPGELATDREQFGLFLGTAEIPDNLLAQNPYGVAFSLSRREQLELNPAQLARAFDAVTDADLRRAAAEVFAPSRHAGAFIAIKP